MDKICVLIVYGMVLLSLAYGQPGSSQGGTAPGGLSPGGGLRVPSVPNVPPVPLLPRPRSGPVTNGNPGNTRRAMAPSGSSAAAGQSSACASAGRGAIAQCFQSNGGFQMQNVIWLISRGSQGTAPTNANRMREAVCGQEGVIVACMFEGIGNLETSSQCPTPNDYSRLQQETLNLITGVQVLCGKGPVPAASPCLNELNSRLATCFSDIGMDPGLIFGGGPQGGPQGGPRPMTYSTGNLSQIIVGAIIGKDSNAAGKFCRTKERLFTCMKTVMDQCEGSSEVVALSGFEPESLRKGIEVLCHDVNVYVDGLKCFQNVPREADRCHDNLQKSMAELTGQQLQTSMPLGQFYDRFCQMRIQHMECDLQAWRNQCQPKTLGLKNEFECALLPMRCKNDRSLQGRLQQTCAIKRFQRHLRAKSGAAPTLTLTKATMMVASIVVVFIL